MAKKSSVQIEYRKISELEKLGGNPRYILEDDMARLKQSIQDNPDYFEARPIILSNRTGSLVILAGNQRYEAAKLLGMEEVPTVLLEGLSENREKEIVIRDNVSNGKWDWDILANENWGDVDELKGWGVDISFMQTSEVDFDNVPDVSKDNYEAPKIKMLECPHCHHTDMAIHFRAFEGNTDDVGSSGEADTEDLTAEEEQ